MIFETCQYKAPILANESQRKTKLSNDFEEMQLLSRNIHRIRFTTRGDPPDFYFVDMGISSVVLESLNTIKIAKNFKLAITLPRDYPDLPPSFRALRDSYIPFHPHFSYPDSTSILGPFAIFLKKGDWVDYIIHDPNEGLGSYVLRIAHSLQFDPNYIYEHPPSSKMGNKKALDWYLKQKAENPNLFPIDKIPLPNRLDDQLMHEHIDNSAPNKKFYVASENSMDSQTSKSTQKKFEITETSRPYQPENINESDFEFNIVGESSDNLHPRSAVTHKLYIAQYAAEQIMQHIDWGKSSMQNRFEQGGLLLGNVFVDSQKNITYGLVEEVIAGESARGSDVNLEMDFETWKEMIDKVDSICEDTQKNKLQVIGWFHTHPGHLDVFMSDADKEMQKRFFNQNWQFTIVLNPHKMIWRVYYGKNSEVCKGYVTDNEQE